MADSSSTPRSLKAQITRTSLVLAAAALLREQGPKAVTYRKVAKWAGAASSSVGYYFESVTELLSEAARYNIQLWSQRAEKAADYAETLEPQECRKQLVELLAQACLPDDSQNLTNHYEQLISASEAPAVTESYQKGRFALDTAVDRILSHAGVALTSRLAIAIVDGGAVEAISEGNDVRTTVSRLLGEAIGDVAGSDA